ncbi:Mu transposase C-terminal domain-containing protein [Desulfovibrio oxyclinae]|uniref:Mu transposase C-terminal domain-containing protein n=1 Tax=Desulfovibrio oxyclinae TaxID=63560 RepID=UPI00036625B1|nr:Mu transposase C-terminal domain-containing protein [Desulfovibrio oxyclinae]
MFRVNEVLDYNGQLFRVLSVLAEEVVWIKVEDPKAFPSLVLVRELVKGLDEDALKRTNDPFADLALVTPKRGSATQKRRDKNHALIQPIVSDPFFYEPNVRASRIKEVVANQKVSMPTVYTLIRRYWQQGQTPNALLPNYKNSGAKGKKRKANTKKLGRPRIYTPGVGAVVDDEVERLFRITIDKHWLKDTEISFSYLHRRFKDRYEAYYPDVPEEEIPSKWQMLHFYKREYAQANSLEKRTDRIKYNKDVRPLDSTANTNVLGPGSRYEIDATIADIYLVSDSERGNIVGRPVIYLVKDVFSRMVAGFYVGFENASYVAAIQALSVAMTDKVELCAEFGFDIASEDWPTVGLPSAILADRGELLGQQIESLESNFSIRVENTPPYRGDAKGIVERNFRTLQADFKPFAPGVVGKTMIRKHGGRDYRLDAKLSVREFKTIILSSILMHNRFHVLEKYDREPDMLADLEMTPLSLWNWGIQNRTGRLRAASEEAIRISLLPRTKATVSELGISVFGVYYTSQELLERGWLHRTKEVRRPQGLQAAYDPASADIIYLFPDVNGSEYWPCRLTQRSREFAGASFWEVWQVKDAQKKATAKGKLREDEEKRKHEQLVQNTINKAQQRAPRDVGRNNAERIREIRTNRKNEKRAERQQRSQQNGQKAKAVKAKTIPFKDTEAEDYSYPDLTDEIFGNEDK